MAIEKNIKINVDTSGAVKEVDNLTGSFKELDKESGKTKKSVDDVASNGGAIAVLDQLTGGLATRMKDAFEATKLFNLSLKGTKTALIATGVGAFVVALGLIVAYWDDIDDAIRGTTKALENQHEAYLNVINDLNNALALNKLDQEINEKKGVSTKELVQLEKDLLIEKQKTIELDLINLEAQLLREESKKRELTLIEKGLIGLKAYFGIQNIGDAVSEGFGFNVLSEIRSKIVAATKLLKETQLALTDEVKKGDTKKDDKIDNPPDILGTGGIFNNTDALDQKAETIKNFYKQIQDTDDFYWLKGIEREISDIERKTEQDIAELVALGAQKELIEQIEKQSADKIAAIVSDANIKAADEAISLAQSEANAKKQIQNNLFEIASGLAREGSELGKGIAASQATINTFQGITAALAATSVVPDPIGAALKVANAVAIGVAGFANVKKILSTKPITTSAPSGGAGGSAPAAPSFNLVQGTASNQIADSLQTQNAPVKAFVVSSDVTTSQELDRNIVRDNSL